MKKISFLGVNFGAAGGPNVFSYRLANDFLRRGYLIAQQRDENEIASIVFVQYPTHLLGNKRGIFQRLDGLWYNINQDWKSMNEPIKAVYDVADGIIFQSDFSKNLVFNFFGETKNYQIIHNGCSYADYEIERYKAMAKTLLLDIGRDGKNYDVTFSAVSTWRNHKRLKEICNIVSELRKSINCRLIVAGSGDSIPDILDKGLPSYVYYLGPIKPIYAPAVYYASQASFSICWCDNCPNTVVESIAAGVPAIVSNSGGTKEIVGNSGLVLDCDPGWDFKPHDHLNPPKIDVVSCATKIAESKIWETIADSNSVNMNNAAEKYLKFIGAE